MKVLIAGGAGYIGSTVATICIDNGITPIILDNLSSGAWTRSKTGSSTTATSATT